MNKKGLTLIELIAVIAIIALIILIAFPKINGTIIENKKKLYKEQENRLVEAATKYINDNYIEDNIDNFSISKNILISNGYIKEIYDLSDKNNVCNAYVYVTSYLTSPKMKAYLSCSSYETEGYDSLKQT